ncbi:hypothetical protein IHEIED_03368 [Methylorubrum populi]
MRECTGVEDRLQALEAIVLAGRAGDGKGAMTSHETPAFAPGLHSHPMRILGEDAPTVDAMCRLLAYAVYLAQERGRENPHETVELIEYALKTYLRDPRSLRADRFGQENDASR